VLRKTDSRGNFILADKQGWTLYFGIFFILLGLMAAAAAVIASPPETEVTAADRVVTAAVGLLAAAGGVYFVIYSPRSHVHVSVDRQILMISRTGFQLKEHESFNTGEIDDVYVIASDDHDRASAYSLRMRLIDGSEVPLTLNWFKDRESLEENARLLKQNIFR
jgi:hypothetical protein